MERSKENGKCQNAVHYDIISLTVSPLQKVQFRNAVAGTSMDNYHNDGGSVAFSRGNKGFFAMAKNGNFQKTLATGKQ